MPRAGRLDREIILRRRSVTGSDEYNQPIFTVAEVTLWARRVTGKGGEAEAAQSVDHVRREIFRVRQPLTISRDDQILFEDLVFEIVDIREPGLRGAEYEIECKAAA